MIAYKSKVHIKSCGICFIKHQYSYEYVHFYDYFVKGVNFQKEFINYSALRKFAFGSNDRIEYKFYTFLNQTFNCEGNIISHRILEYIVV